MSLEIIKNKNPNPFKIVFQNFYGNSAKALREGKVTASKKNQLSKTVDDKFTWKDLELKFDQQKQQCYWFRVKLDPQNNYIKNHPLALSVDRLDSNKGYTFDNIVISSRLANLGRGAFPAEEFEKICNLIIGKEYNPEDMDSLSNVQQLRLF